MGLGQRFNRLVRIAYSQNIFASDDHIEVGKALSRAAIDDFASTHAKAGQYGALVGFSLGGRPRLCEFTLADFQPEFKDKRIWYVSKGSGQPITDPFLALMRSVFWKNRPPTVRDGTFALTWALEHAIEVNPGGINGPIQIAVLERGTTSGASLSARFLDDTELQEHKESIAAAKDLLRDFAAHQEPGRRSEGLPKVTT